MISCPHCSKELTDVVAKSTFDDRISKLSEKNKELATSLQKAEGLAKQAAPLAAKANGYEFDADSLEMLQARYEKGQKSGYESDFASWLADAEGAGKDPVASRFRASAPSASPASPPAAAPKATEATPAATPRLPTTPTATNTPAVVRMTQEQVSAVNARLMQEYKSASAERRAAIKTEVQKNWDQVGSTG
jgi:hypothetical protein